MSTPRRTSKLLVEGATLVLPAGEVRDRYRQELLAELHGLERSQQPRHALGVVLHALALRRAVIGGEHVEPAAAGESAPVHCRLHLYHHHRKTSTDDGQVFWQCVDCGHIKDNYLDPACPSISSRGLPMP